MAKDQAFLDGHKLKEDLTRLTEYYKALPEEVKKTGTARYAAYPPLEGDFRMSRHYDRFTPDWRRRAVEPYKPVSTKDNAAIMAKLKPFMDAIKKDEERQGTGRTS